MEGNSLFLIGTAGSGKSRMTAAMARWLKEQSFDAVTVNLDPGAERLPYAPDVDVRDWIVLSEVMDKYELGPNGAQVLAADLLATRIRNLEEALEEFDTDVVLFDTPGQTELFVFREGGRYVVDYFRARASIAFLIDPFLARDTSGFVGQLLLSATAQFRFQVPLLNVLSKADLVETAERERLLSWGADPAMLTESLLSEKATLHAQLNTGVHALLQEFGTASRLVAASAETLQGLEEVYAFVQETYAASEDIDKR